MRIAQRHLRLGDDLIVTDGYRQGDLSLNPAQAYRILDAAEFL